ncbi:MAG: hypothetical protein M5R36_03530 [Deltaproteobacteria bacterium]|nr:hypothetical protein [Deltaproteobacteria bacterium]
MALVAIIKNDLDIQRENGRRFRRAGAFAQSDADDGQHDFSGNVFGDLRGRPRGEGFGERKRVSPARQNAREDRRLKLKKIRDSTPRR